MNNKSYRYDTYDATTPAKLSLQLRPRITPSSIRQLLTITFDLLGQVLVSTYQYIIGNKYLQLKFSKA